MHPGKNNQYADSFSTLPVTIEWLHGWTRYYQILIIYTFKIYELPGGQMYGNKGMFYGDTKN